MEPVMSRPEIYCRSGYQITEGVEGWVVYTNDLQVADPFRARNEAESAADALPPERG